jgi:hypothetical protein
VRDETLQREGLERGKVTVISAIQAESKQLDSSLRHTALAHDIIQSSAIQCESPRIGPAFVEGVSDLISCRKGILLPQLIHAELSHDRANPLTAAKPILQHRDGFCPMPCSSKLVSGGGVMENPSLVLAISKLAAAGEEAGFTLEQMMERLDRGLEVEALLELVCWRSSASSNWVL